MKFSRFGQKFNSDCGILQLMEDLGSAVAGNADVMMLGGGNPSHIPAIERCLRERMESILNRPGEFERLIGNYSPPQGDAAFRSAVAELLNHSLGWPVTHANIALTNGSQTAFYYLFNMLAGRFDDGAFKKILLPLTPEYIGYADTGLEDDLFISFRPEIVHRADRIFKYKIDFEALKISDDIGAICVSRPTNPTGNVLSDDEIAQLHQLAKEHDVPLIIDNAYGPPFPNILYSEVNPIWDEQIIYCLSLSKLGLPGARTGIVVAREEIASAIAGANAVLSLAPGNLGSYMALDLVKTGDIIQLSREVVQPHYHEKAQKALDWITSEMKDVNYYVHDPEGAFFLWLWFKDLPITSQVFYERLKQRGVLVVPGHYFFPGLPDEWSHRYECIRMNYAQDDEIVQRGLQIIAEEARRCYE